MLHLDQHRRYPGPGLGRGPWHHHRYRRRCCAPLSPAALNCCAHWDYPGPRRGHAALRRKKKKKKRFCCCCRAAWGAPGTRRRGLGPKPRATARGAPPRSPALRRPPARPPSSGTGGGGRASGLGRCLLCTAQRGPPREPAPLWNACPWSTPRHWPRLHLPDLAISIRGLPPGHRHLRSTTATHRQWRS